MNYVKVSQGRPITAHVLSDLAENNDPTVVCSYEMDVTRPQIPQMIEALQRMQANEMAKPYKDRNPAIVDDAPR